MNRVIINCDGLCEPNPGGVACWGYVAVGEQTELTHRATGGQVQPEVGEVATNHVAEYAAVEAALRWVEAKQLFFLGYNKSVLIRTDSQLVVNQLTGKWNCHSETLKPRLKRVEELIRRLRDTRIPVEVEWVPREQNESADELSREAYRIATGDEVPVRPQWQKRKKALR